MSEYSKYTYKGPVEVYGKCVCSCWEDTSYAKTSKQARRNMVYHYKKQALLKLNTVVTLPGEVVLAE